jgi:hypothetical protein
VIKSSSVKALDFILSKLNNIKKTTEPLSESYRTGLSDRNYFTQTVGDSNLAFWGRANQNIEDFQNEVFDVFVKGKDSIAKMNTRINKQFEREMNATYLVNSGIGGEKVTP